MDIVRWLIAAAVLVFALTVLVAGLFDDSLMLALAVIPFSLFAVLIAPPYAKYFDGAAAYQYGAALLFVTGLGLLLSSALITEVPAPPADKVVQQPPKLRQQIEATIEAKYEAQKAQFVAQRDKIINQLNALIKKQKYREAMQHAQAYAEFDTEIVKLIQIAKAGLKQQARLAKEQTLLAQYAKIPADDLQGRIDMLNKLATLIPDNREYPTLLQQLQAQLQQQLATEKEQALIAKWSTTSLYDIEGRLPILRSLLELSPSNAEYQSVLKTYLAKQYWHLRAKVSEMDDSVNVYLHVPSISTTASSPLTAQLHVRCQENTTAVYIHWNTFISSTDQSMRYRIDNQPAKVSDFSISSDHKALGHFSGKQSIPFIKRLLGHDKLLVQVVPHGEHPILARFNIADLKLAIAPLREACHW